jgi:hypothetical protein
MKIRWSDNIVLNMGNTEYSYVPDSIEIERYTEDSIALKIITRCQRANALIPLSKQECKRLIAELAEHL